MILLPEPDDYHYADVIYRLQAESLKEIKEMTEIMIDEPSEDSKKFIENEKKKFAFLAKLLQEEEEKEETVEEKNTIILAPLESGRIRMLDDIDSMPVDFYDDIALLVESIINGSFKRWKKFNFSSSTNLTRVSEVRSQRTRVIYQRLNKNTYALITTFLKKTSNDHGYREYLRSIMSEYRKVEDQLKAGLDNPEFMALHEEYVQEMWNRLGHPEKAKTYGKGGIEC
jgi:hypothetical protein